MAKRDSPEGASRTCCRQELDHRRVLSTFARASSQRGGGGGGWQESSMWRSLELRQEKGGKAAVLPDPSSYCGPDAASPCCDLYVGGRN